MSIGSSVALLTGDAVAAVGALFCGVGCAVGIVVGASVAVEVATGSCWALTGMAVGADVGKAIGVTGAPPQAASKLNSSTLAPIGLRFISSFLPNASGMYRLR
jgi:hypothetical protein